MPRSIWSGAISFGLVNVPVKLYSAVSKKTVRFHQLNGETGRASSRSASTRRRARRSPYESLVKGYEIGRDRYVVITPEELESLDPEEDAHDRHRGLRGPRRHRPAVLRPPVLPRADKGAAKAYRLLVDAMEEPARSAIARVVLRSKEQLVAIRPAGPSWP